MASISRTYFCRFFKRITGHSLRSYHHMVRVRIAEELLQDKSLSITDVATRLGYDDPNYFSTVYKKITGVSPRERKSSYRDAGGAEEKRDAGRAFPVANVSPERGELQDDVAILREWHSSYTALYRDRTETRSVKADRETPAFSARRQTSGITPRYRKAACQGLATIKKLNEELDIAFEGIEP